MVLGNSMSVLLKLEVDISELSKLKAARAQMEKFEKKSQQAGAQVNRAMQQGAVGASTLARGVGSGNVELKKMSINTDRASKNFRRLRAAGAMASAALSAGLKKVRVSAAKAAARVQQLTGSLQQAKMAMLGLMFTSLNMVFIFGGILALSPRIRAGLMAIAGALRLIAIEAGEMLFPHLMDLAEAIRNLNEEQRELIAKIAIVGTLMAVAGVLIGAFGQAFLSLLGIFGTFGRVGVAAASRVTLAMSILASTATRLVVGVGGAIMTLGGLFVKAGGLIKGAVGVIAGGSLLAFGKIIIIVGAVIGAVALLVAAFNRGGGNIRKTMKTVGGNIRTIGNSILKVFKNVVAEVTKLIGDLMIMFGKFTDQFAGIISAVIRPGLKAMGAQFIITFNLIANLITGASKNFRKGMKLMASLAKDAANLVIDAFNGMANFIADSLNFVIKRFNEAASALPGLEPISLVQTEDITADKFQKNVKDSLEKANKDLDKQLVDLAGLVGGKEAKKQVSNLNEVINKTFDEENVRKFGKGLKSIGEDVKGFGKDLSKADITIAKIAKTLKELPGKAISGLKDALPDKIGKIIKKVQTALQGSAGSAGLSQISSILGGKNVSQAGGMTGSQIGREIKETTQEIRNEVNIDADISEEIDIREVADEINEELQRTTKRSGFNL